MGFGARCQISILTQHRRSLDNTLRLKPGHLSRAEECLAVATMKLMVTMTMTTHPPLEALLIPIQEPMMVLRMTAVLEGMLAT
jgi:hypothetical protein